MTPRPSVQHDALSAGQGSADLPVVLHVRTVSGTGGGPDKTILRSARAMPAGRYRVEVACLYPAGDRLAAELAAEARRWDCPLHLLDERGPFDLRTVSRLTGLCRRLGVAIWHGHDYKSNLLGLLVGRFHPMKRITTVHGWGDRRWRARLYEQLDRWTLRRYDRVVAVSPAIARRCRAMGVAKRRLVEIANGIDPAEWQCPLDRVEARRRLGLPQEALLLGSVSRLCHEKGIDRLLPVVGQLAERFPSLRYVVVGSGPMENRLKRQARALGLDQKVWWVGWRKPMHPWYRAMDGLVMPSRTEGLPNTLLEAMVMGLPVAGTDVGAVGELLGGGRFGLLLSDDRGRWAGQLEAWLADGERRQRLAGWARGHVLAHYGFDRRMERMAGQYDLLLGRASRPGRQAA